MVAVLLLPAVPGAQSVGQAGPIIEVVPVVELERVPGSHPVPGWMVRFGDYADRFWRQSTGRAVDFTFRQSPALRWRRCDGCTLSPYSKDNMVPWLSQLAERYKRTARKPDGYLLLLDSGSIEGAGFFMSEEILVSEFGIAGFSVLAADRPQAALHEIGHFLNLPDRYDPHGPASNGVLTLMGWMDQPVAPLDPILRVHNGWAEHRVLQPRRDPYLKVLYPEDVLEVQIGQGSAWLGLQAIPGEEGADGWMFEIDWHDDVVPFERIEEYLMPLDLPEQGEEVVHSQYGTIELRWRFIPDTPRILVEVRFEEAPLVPLPPRPPERSGGCAATGGADWVPLLLLAAFTLSRRRLIK